MLKPEVTVMLSAFVVLCCGLLESATWTVKLVVPVPVGVPVMAPVEAFTDNPAGSDPIVTLQVNGVAPPIAVKFAL